MLGLIVFVFLICCAVLLAMAKLFVESTLSETGDKSSYHDRNNIIGGRDMRPPSKNRDRGAVDNASKNSFLPQTYIERSEAARTETSLPNVDKWSDTLKSYIHNSKYPFPDFIFRLLWNVLDITGIGAAEKEPVVRMDQIPSVVPYSGKVLLAKMGVHIGQRKLFLNEIYFISRRVPASENAVVVYAGSAPANKGAFLAAVTPNITWIFVDPAEFNIIRKNFNVTINTVFPKKGVDDPREQALSNEIAYRCVSEIRAAPARINIINAYMTNSLALAIAKIYEQNTVYFISDIRTSMYVGGDNKRTHPDTADLTMNNVWQYNWMRIMQPKYSMLKFRHPFYAENPDNVETAAKDNRADFAMAADTVNGVAGIDFLANARAKRLVYFGGDVYIQPWAPRTSTEVRLETDCKTIVEHDPAQHDARLFIFNVAYRNLRLTQNPNADPSMGFDHCNDCAHENVIWTKWLETYGATITAHNASAPSYELPTTVGKCVAELTKAIGERSLIVKDASGFIFHGDFMKRISVDRFVKMLKHNQSEYEKWQHGDAE